MEAILVHILVVFKEYGSAKMIIYLHNKINKIVPIHGLCMNDDGTLSISYIHIPSEEQANQVASIIDNLELERTRAVKLEELDLRWLSSVANGWTSPDGWRFGIDTQDVALLTGAFMLAKEAATINPTGTVPIIDLDGVAHQLTLTEMTSLMLQYGQYRSGLSSEYATKRALVEELDTAEEIEAI